MFQVSARLSAWKICRMFILTLSKMVFEEKEPWMG